VLENVIADAKQWFAGVANGAGDALGFLDAHADEIRGRPAVGDPTTTGTLERGPRPQASEVRSARLQVPGDIDHARARADADRALAGIDFSKPNISLWVPATGSHTVPDSWRASIEAGPDGQHTSVSVVDYPATTDFNDSVSTGMETLKLVLAGIAERGGSHRVALAGHSQGAWVIGDTIDDPAIARSIDRAVMYGHPAPARVDWSKSNDPNVQQVDDAADPFTLPLEGGRQALQAVDELQDGAGPSRSPLDLGGVFSRIGTIVKSALDNPRLASYLLGKHVNPESSGYVAAADPHHYDSQYAGGARFLAGVTSRA
jgi:hypothetical protein